MSVVKSLFVNRPAETQAVLLICALGTLRLVISLFVDLFNNPGLTPTELITDLAIFMIFASLLLLVIRKSNFTQVHPLFGIVFILLIGINFLEFGGVLGTNAFNYYSGIYVIVMLYSGRTLYALITIQLIFLSALLYLVYIQHPVYEKILLLINKETLTEFIFSLIAIAAFTFFLKRITLRAIAKSKAQASELNTKVKESKRLNRQLMLQSEELKRAQESLKKEVNHRVAALEKRKEAIEQYIHHNTTSLRDPLNQLSDVVDQLKEDSQLCALIKLSHGELHQVIKSINAALHSQENLNRTTFEKNS